MKPINYVKIDFTHKKVINGKLKSITLLNYFVEKITD